MLTSCSFLIKSNRIMTNLPKKRSSNINITDFIDENDSKHDSDDDDVTNDPIYGKVRMDPLNSNPFENAYNDISLYNEQISSSPPSADNIDSSVNSDVTITEKGMTKTSPPPSETKSSSTTSTETKSNPFEYGITIPFHTFNNIKNNIFYTIFQKATPYIQTHQFSTSASSSTNKQVSHYLTTFNLTNFTYTTVIPRYFTPINPSSSLQSIQPDFNYQLHSLLNNNRNIYSFNTFRCFKDAEFATEKSLTDPLYHAVRFILSFFSNGKLSLNFNNSNDITFSNHSINYLFSAFAANIYQNCTTFILPPKNYAFPSGKSISQRHHLITIPREVQKKLLKISKYFEEMKKFLVLNESNGYWCYEIDHHLVPIICTHEYMSLNHDPFEDISLKCYLNGKCKYCDQELSAYHEMYCEYLPPVIYSIIFRYVDSIVIDIDSDRLNFALFDIIYAMIMKIKKSNTSELAEGTITALVAVYLYKVYLTTRDQVQYNTAKITKYIDDMYKFCATVGWTLNNVSALVNSDKIDVSTANMLHLINSCSYTTNVKYTETLPLSVLFMQNINPTTKYELKPSTNLQKIYCAGENKMLLFNITLDKALLKLWDMRIVANVINTTKVVKVIDKTELIKISTMRNGITFFDLISKWYCPHDKVNAHEWKGDVCTNCGLKKDLSNKDEIYMKYQVVINNFASTPPELNIKGMYDDVKVVDIVKLVEKYDETKTFLDYVPIKNYSLIEQFTQQINEGSNNAQLVDYIEKVLHAKMKTRTPQYVMKALSYIGDKKLDTSKNIIVMLHYVFTKINDVRKLMLLQKNKAASRAEMHAETKVST